MTRPLCGVSVMASSFLSVQVRRAKSRILTGNIASSRSHIITLAKTTGTVNIFLNTSLDLLSKWQDIKTEAISHSSKTDSLVPTLIFAFRIHVTDHSKPCGNGELPVFPALYSLDVWGYCFPSFVQVVLDLQQFV